MTHSDPVTLNNASDYRANGLSDYRANALTN